MDMFSLGPGTAPADMGTVYPQVGPFTTRERLLQEREASGMFFSGQLLDDYSRCVGSLSVMPILGWRRLPTQRGRTASRTRICRKQPMPCPSRR